MTLQEILKSQGLTDEQIEKITGAMKQNKIYLSSDENLDEKYKGLQSQLESKSKEHQEATALIEQLKKDNAGNEALQTKITEYEDKIEQLQTELEEAKINSAIKVALLEANVTDVDYLTFKIKEKGEIKLDEKGAIEGINDTLTSLKTQYPQHFASESSKKIEENRLPNGDGNKETEPQTLAEALRNTYENTN